MMLFQVLSTIRTRLRFISFLMEIQVWNENTKQNQTKQNKTKTIQYNTIQYKQTHTNTTDGGPDKILKAIPGWESKRAAPIPIHTIAFAATSGAKGFMEKVANMTGGVYRSIAWTKWLKCDEMK